MTVPYRWKRLHRSVDGKVNGKYIYSCAAELRRSSALVYKKLGCWFFETKFGGERGSIEIGARTCECCGTNFRGEVLGWDTHTEAQRAAEIFIENE